MESSQRDAPPLQPSFIHLSKSSVYEPHFPSAYQVPIDWKGAPRRQICPYPETFSTYLLGSPVKELTPGPLHGASSEREREAIHPHSPLHPSLKVPGRGALLQVPQTGPLWKEMPISRTFFYISFRVPSKGAHL
jgi:hypothetical protein